MQNDYYTRTTCRICQSSALDAVFSMQPTPPGDWYWTPDQASVKQEIYPLDLHVCRDCALAQLNGVISPELLYKNYIYSSKISVGFPEHLAESVLTIVERIKPDSNSLVVDIGSNDGTFLRAFRKSNFRVLGVDPAERIARLATESGIETWSNYFSIEVAEKIRRKHGAPTIVTANNVIANIDDLPDFLSALCVLLPDDGVFVFETGYGPDLVRNNIIDNIYHEHLCYFSLMPLVRLFRQFNLEIFHVDHLNTKGGSIRVFVKRKSAKFSATQSLELLLQSEELAGFDSAKPYKEMASRVETLRHSLLSFFEQARLRGHLLGGFGASVGVTSLIYYFRMGEAIRFLADENGLRHGLASPGFKIPIVSPVQISTLKPDYLILFPWRYAESIIKRVSPIMPEGARFVVPLPELRII